MLSNMKIAHQTFRMFRVSHVTVWRPFYELQLYPFYMQRIQSFYFEDYPSSNFIHFSTYYSIIISIPFLLLHLELPLTLYFELFSSFLVCDFPLKLNLNFDYKPRQFITNSRKDCQTVNYKPANKV